MKSEKEQLRGSAKLMWVAALFSFESMLFGIVLSLICIYSAPVKSPSDITASPLFFLNTAFMACFLLRLVLTGSNRNVNTPTLDSARKWLFLFLGVVLGVGAVFVGLVFIYVVEPVRPYASGLSFLLLATISSIFFYRASEIGSPQKPNLLRWIVVLLTGFLFYSHGMVLALIFIYALPVKPQVAEPYGAAIAFLGTTVYTCLIIAVASRRVAGTGAVINAKFVQVSQSPFVQ